ncbi:DUF3108 domain-containing protein [Thioflexithrix psekupsensis]|uniref:DUF3108 domain-containing protein n=1 Tax=Thioflexithrix psekupsensis TaxID=1570016 RepID=A0A251XBL0_9GAMM|nr:DUF3108 domain-containing protein [Thioflexithrix psekupsensis]OUD15456.1 hypothetical protein TPSD3_02720 [Thioflexithrix psekupsensis]
MKWIYFLALFLALSLTRSGFAGEIWPLPPSFTAHYSVYLKGLPVGKGVRRFYSQGENYVFETQTETSGIAALFRGDVIMERSLFSQTASGLIQPLRYEYKHARKKNPRHDLIEFDWTNGVANNTIVGQEWSVPLSEGVLDNMLYQLVLMQQLAAGERDLSFKVAYKGEVRTYTPRFLGEEAVNIGAQQVNTLKYQRISDDGKRQTTLWCAPQWHFLPIKVEHVEKGDAGVLILERVEGL